MQSKLTHFWRGLRRADPDWMYSGAALATAAFMLDRMYALAAGAGCLVGGKFGIDSVRWLTATGRTATKKDDSRTGTAATNLR